MYKLGAVLGGRREVMAAPAVELLSYMDAEMDRLEAEAEKERVRIFLNFLSNVYSQPSQGKDSASFNRDRQKYIESITPKQKNESEDRKFDWDENLMKRLIERQNGGKKGEIVDGDNTGDPRIVHSGSEGDQ